MPLYRDEQGNFFDTYDPFREALLSLDMVRAEDGSAGVYPLALPLPALTTPNPTPADLELHRRLSGLYTAHQDYNRLLENPGVDWTIDPNGWDHPNENGYGDFSALLGDIAFGSLHPGGNAYTDPGLLGFTQNTIANASRRDAYSPFGDQFTTALLGLGLATGGAALYNPAILSGGAGAGAAGAGGEVLSSAVPATVGAEGLAGTIAPSSLGAFAGPAVEGGELLGTSIGLNAGTTLGGATASGIASVPVSELLRYGSLLNTLASGGSQLFGGGEGTTATGTTAGDTAALADIIARANRENTGVLGTGLTGGELLKLGITGGTTIAGLVNAIAARGDASNAASRATASIERVNDALALQTDIARQLFNDTGPLRGLSVGGLNDFLAQGTIPPALQQGLNQAIASGRGGLEQQYRVAREQLISQTPTRGGQLSRGLMQLGRDRANAVGSLRASLEMPLRQSLFQAATGLGFGQAGTALQGFANVANQQANLANLFTTQANTASTQSTLAGQQAGGLLALALFQAAGQQPSVRNTTGNSDLFGLQF